MKSGLRAVDPGESAPPKPFESLVDAVERGTYRDVLIWQRKDIAGSIPNEKGPAKAALHRQLQDISKELEALDAKVLKSEEGAGAANTPDEAWDAEAI